MSTRGVIGFHLNGQDKVSYNHADSYPSGLGKKIVQFIQNTRDQELLTIATKIRLVSEDSHPTPHDIEKYLAYANRRVAGGNLNDWYVLLHQAQGYLDAYRNENFDVMVDYQTFLRDSTFCEWAYLINLDDGVLEIYAGGDGLKAGPGRYASQCNEDDQFGVHLIRSFTLEEVRCLDAETFGEARWAA